MRLIEKWFPFVCDRGSSEIVAVCRPEAGLCRWLAYFTPARREMLQFRYLRNINSRFTQWVRVGSVGKFQFLPEAQRF